MRNQVKGKKHSS